MSARKTILLVDDDSRYLELVEMMLMVEGYSVICECDGESLLESTLENMPDIIVMDIMLGRLNGIELAHALRRSDKSADIPIVFASAWTGRGETKLPRNSARLFKPFTQSELVATIHALLDVTNTVVGESNE